MRVNPPKVLPIIRPVYNEFNSDIIGWSYLSISEELLTDYLSSYPLGNDGILFFTMGDLTYYLKDGKFEIAKDFYSPLKDLTYYALNDTTQVDSVRMSDGSKRIMITIPVDGVRRMVLFSDSVRTAIRSAKKLSLYSDSRSLPDYLLSGHPFDGSFKPDYQCAGKGDPRKN